MNEHKTDVTKVTFMELIPLIAILAIILALTVIRQSYEGWNWRNAMTDYMGFFFIIFGSFKIFNLPGFVEAYQMYDIIAQRSTAYAYLYPFIELALGIMYLMRYQLFYVNIITVIIMSISAVGVWIELMKGKKIVCACLGAVFKLPMTYVTLLEDLLMAGMALTMLLM